MNEEQPQVKPETPDAPAPPPPPPAPAPQPENHNAGSTSDRSPLQSAYPTFSANQPSIASAGGELGRADDPVYSGASHDFNDAITLICGLASSICYILIYFLVKNSTVTIIICLALSGAAIYFAMKNYRKTQNITPLEVIGLSAATITLVFIGTIIVTNWVIRSQINSLY
jgi:hypothetical protein